MGYEPGKSGNLRGRPKKTMEQILFEHRCREYLEKAGFNEILALANSATKADKKWALEVMLDRGFGRAETRIDAEVSHQGSGTCSPIELIGEIAAIAGEAVDSGAGRDKGSGSVAEPGKDTLVPAKQGAGEIH